MGMFVSKYNSIETVDALRDAVNAGEIELTLVIGAPRTVTTALAGALGQAEEIGVENVFHECFTNGNYDPMMEYLQDPERKKPQHIIIKEMANCRANEKLLPLCKHVIFTTREPLQWAVANQLRKTNGASKIQNFNVNDLPDQKKLSDTAESAEERGVRGIKRTFEKNNLEETNGWLRQISMFKTVKGSPEISIIDGDVFRVMPENILQTLSKKSGITYSEQMVGGWKKTHDTRHDAWCRTYNKSSGIQRPQQVTPNADGIYERVDYDKAATKYTRLMASDYAVRPTAQRSDTSIEEALNAMAVFCDVKTKAKFIDSLRGKNVSILRFDDLAPPSAYAYIASYPVEGAHEQELQSQYLEDLRERHPEHAKGFDLLDAGIKKTHTPETVLQLTEEQIIESPSKGRVID